LATKVRSSEEMRITRELRRERAEMAEACGRERVGESMLMKVVMKRGERVGLLSK
jgi:hypothetical protein